MMQHLQERLPALGLSEAEEVAFTRTLAYFFRRNAFLSRVAEGDLPLLRREVAAAESFFPTAALRLSVAYYLMAEEEVAVQTSSYRSFCKELLLVHGYMEAMAEQGPGAPTLTRNQLRASVTAWKEANRRMEYHLDTFLARPEGQEEAHEILFALLEELAAWYREDPEARGQLLAVTGGPALGKVFAWPREPSAAAPHSTTPLAGAS